MTTTLRPLQDTLRPTGRLGRYATYAVCANGRQIGSIVLADHNPQGGVTGWIESLQIMPERRGRSHGSVAMLIAEEVLRAWGCCRVALTVPAAASACMAVARHLGYTVEACAMVAVLPKQAPPLPAGGVLRPMRADERGAGYVQGGPDVPVWVLEMLGRPVGVLYLADSAPDGTPGRGWIHRAALVPGRRAAGTDPGHRRTLLGAAALQSLRAGLHELGLTVAGDDRALFRLAGSLGYEVRTACLAKPL